MAMAAMADPKAVASDIAKRLGITTTTLYTYVNGDGSQTRRVNGVVGERRLEA